MKIGITYNLKDEISPLSIFNSEFNEEFDSDKTIEAICSIFRKYDFQIVRLKGGLGIVNDLRSEKVDFVFNIAEGYYGRNRESFVPAILESLNIPYSGSDALTLGLTLDKIMAKKLFQFAKIPTPPYAVLEKIEDIKSIENIIEYPMMTKPSWEGSSKGIYNSSRVFDRAGLEENVKTLLKKYPGQPVLVEEYIKGREITVGVVGNKSPNALGLMEIINKQSPGEDFFYSLEVKRQWQDLVEYQSPPDIPKAMATDIRRYASMAFREFGCRDIARMDFRISEYSQPYLLEINPLPGLSPESGDLVIMAQKNGIGYEDLILTILNNAFSRYGFRQIEKKQAEAVGL